MIVRTPVMLALTASVMAALPIAADCKPPPHALTTQELKAVVPGSSIGRPSTGYESAVEQFWKDGTYLQLADNSGDEGTYTIKDGRICIQSRYHKNLCRYLLRDQDGQYWLTMDDLPNGLNYRVGISKH